MASGQQSSGRNRRRTGRAPSADTQIVDALHRLAADSAEKRTAIAAQQGLGHRPGTVRAVEFGGGGLRIGHAAIIARSS